MGGGGHSTEYVTQTTPNDYDDAWIRSKFGNIDQQGLDFSNWRAGREATLGSEKDLRERNRDMLSSLSTDFARSQEQIKNLQSGAAALTSDFAGLTGAQLQTAKDLFNLSNTPGSGTTRARTNQGLTYSTRSSAGPRTDLQTSSLNI